MELKTNFYYPESEDLGFPDFSDLDGPSANPGEPTSTTKKVEPRTRKEHYLAKIAGEDVTIPEPKTRQEHFLKEIAENGGSGGGGNPPIYRILTVTNTDSKELNSEPGGYTVTFGSNEIEVSEIYRNNSIELTENSITAMATTLEQNNGFGAFNVIPHYNNDPLAGESLRLEIYKYSSGNAEIAPYAISCTIVEYYGGEQSGDIATEEVFNA